jgi:hypothetical protein
MLIVALDFSNFTTKTFPIVLDHETKSLVEVCTFTLQIQRALTPFSIGGVGLAMILFCSTQLYISAHFILPH